MNLNQNIIKKTYIFFISFLFIFFSCNSDDDHKTPADKKKDAFVTVTGVNLDKEELSLEVGAESTLIATVTPTTATNKKVTWSSDKTDIATVANGLVTAVAVGTATITVTASADNTKTDTVTVTVTSTLTEFSIADISVTRGTTSFVISPTLIPSEATVDYELITKPTGVTMAGTTINIAADMDIGEYNIAVKATGNGDYNGEIRANLKLTIVSKNDDFVIDFTDVNFKNAVKSYYNIATNDVTYGDIKDRVDLYVENKQIANMDEIGHFISLEELHCYNNQLTSLDLSQNTNLEKVYCFTNQLTSLDFGQNANLTVFSCANNQLSNLDLSQNTNLEFLNCSNNNLLTSLDMRGMREVDIFNFDNTTLQTLKVHQNIKDHQRIIDLKISRGDNVTISTYNASAGSTTYALICNNYVPRASGGSCND